MEEGITVERLIAALAGSDAAARWEAVSRAHEAGPAAVQALGRIMQGNDPAAAKAASEALKRLVHAAAKPGQDTGKRKAVSGELLKQTRAGNARAVRSDALMYLGLIGGREQVQGIQALLADTDVREYARMALERIPGRDAEAALKGAEVTASYKAAIQQSLRHRRHDRRDVGVKS